MIQALHRFPGLTGCLSTISAFATIDFLRMSQIAAAMLAGLVSLGTFIIIMPKISESLAKFPEAHRKAIKALREIRDLFRKQ